jgi:hypothetical protein
MGNVLGTTHTQMFFFQFACTIHVPERKVDKSTNEGVKLIPASRTVSVFFLELIFLGAASLQVRKH